jgi:hypothetical protein
MTRWIAVLAAAALMQAPAAAGWSWPVDGPVLRPFVFGDDPYAGGQHRGIDIGAPPETPVHAASAGTVSFAGTVPAGGRAVTVQTGGGLSVTYLELGVIRVARGAEVVEGEPIGTVGPAAHVHLGVRLTADPHGYRNPLLFLPARVETPAQTDPVEVAPSAAAQPNPVAEPSAAQAAAPEPEGPPPRAAEHPGPPPVATEPPAARPEPVASDAAPAPDELAEPPGKAGVKSGARETPAPMAEPVATENPPASEPTAEATAPSRPAVVRPSATPARRPARAKPKRSAGKPSSPPEAPSVPARSKEVAEPVAPASGRPGLAAATRVGQAMISEAPAQRQARRRPERPREESGPAHLGLAVGLLAVAVVGAAAAAGAAVRRRDQAVPHEGASAEAAKPRETASCPLGRLRAPHVIHACARAQEPGWVVPLGTPRRRPAPLQRARPLPRPRRSVLAGARS